MAKKTDGRRKVEIVKVDNQKKRHVTFTKRRSGLFNKARVLHDDYGAEIAILVSSPGHKTFSFGNPDFESVITRYLSRNPVDGIPDLKQIEAERKANIQRLTMQLAELERKTEDEKKRFEELSQGRNVSQDRYWWEVPVEELSLPELHQLKSVLGELNNTIVTQAERVLAQDTNPQQFFIGSSSRGALPNYQTANIAFDAKSMPQAHASSTAPNPPGYNHNLHNHNPNPQACNPGPSGFGHGFY
ncbi:hypothetical protein DITRI_Ditri01bG0018100 [Diplodiscus trichospermus]